MNPVLILGTGRCGSTLLSNMIRQHPEALSVSELFSFVSDLGMRIESIFPEEELSGADFWEILATPQPRQSTLLRHGLQMKEVIYPWGRGRFTPETGLPPIMQALIPHLDSESPDQLFDQLAQEVVTWPTTSANAQYRRLLEWLTQHFNRSFWVERSGGSLRVSGRLLKVFPDAKVIHLVRDGRDTAISMSKHIGFRMAILCTMQAQLLGNDPYESNDRSEESDLEDDLVNLLPENFSKEAFDSFELSPELCAHYWAGEIATGLQGLAKLSPDRLLTLRYEDLTSDPVKTLEKVGSFIDDSIDPEWVEQAASLAKKQEPRWTALSSKERKQLDDACKTGFEALSAHGIPPGKAS